MQPVHSSHASKFSGPVLTTNSWLLVIFILWVGVSGLRTAGKERTPQGFSAASVESEHLRMCNLKQWGGAVARHSRAPRSMVVGHKGCTARCKEVGQGNREMALGC